MTIRSDFRTLVDLNFPCRPWDLNLAMGRVNTQIFDSPMASVKTWPIFQILIFRPNFKENDPTI